MTVISYQRYFELNDSMVNIIKNTDLSNPDKVGRLNKYLDWKIRHDHFYVKEVSNLDIPDSLFNKQMNPFEYTCNEKIAAKYYYRCKSRNYNRNKVIMQQNDKDELLKHYILGKGKVVWIEFG